MCENLKMSLDVLVFFFFQAEDGIRDRNVTGVQTCALPILGTWKRGTFRVSQRVPDLAGVLTTETKLTGGLIDAGPKELIRHCSDARLTADLEIGRASCRERVEIAVVAG